MFYYLRPLQMPCRAMLLVMFLSFLSFLDASHGYGLVYTNHHDRRELQSTLAIPTESDNRSFPYPSLAAPVEDPSLALYPEDGQGYMPLPKYQEPFHDANTNSSESSPSSPSSNVSTGNACSSKMLVMGYYPDWVASSFPPEKIDFKRFDWIDFAFAIPTADFALAWDNAKTGPDLLKRLVAAAHAQGAKVKLSIGGWTGSKYFSSAVLSDTSRKTFANNILATYKAFGLDGIDIDWEYPGRKGASGNKFRSSDTANFLLFLKTLRDTLPPTARISAAAEATTFINSKGQPTIDLAQFAILDWVLIMNYDLWGSSSKPGPNAPLRDACGNSTQPGANAVAAFNSWTSARFPACKLVLGLPSYGYISSSRAERLRTRSKPSHKPRHSSDSVKVVNDDGDSDGQVQFRELLEQGALVKSTSFPNGHNTTVFIAGGGFERRWDPCSDTPFLRSSASGQVITYDDTESLAMKAAFAKQVGMLGVNMFDIHGDTDTWDLTDCIRKSMDLN